MRHEHEKLIAHRRGLAAFYKAVKVYKDYTVRMNDMSAVESMIQEDKITEENITRAIINYSPGKKSKRHSINCIYEARKRIYKGDQSEYAYFIRTACGNIVCWENATGKLEVGALAFCDRCEKLEEIIEIC